MSELAFLQHLDDDYLRIQDYLSSLVETLPVINPDSIPDAESLVACLVDQNKAYGNQIISLYKTLDAVTISKDSRSDRSHSFISTDGVARLQEKVKEYEDLVQELSLENEGLFGQIRELSQQVKTIQAKQEQQNVSMMSQFQSGENMNLTGNIFQKSNLPSARTTLIHSVNEHSFDIENLFATEDLKRASEVLTQMDYRRPHNITVEKFNTWLIKCNKVKDSEFAEAASKLRNIVESIEYDEGHDKSLKPNYEFEESLDRANDWSLERVVAALEEKLGKVLGHESQRKMSQRNSHIDSNRQAGGLGRFTHSEIQEAAEHLETEGGMAAENLHDKIRFLKENLEGMEKELQSKQDEVEVLKERLEKVKGGHSRTGSTAGKDSLVTDLENEVKNRHRLENRLQELVNENDELKEINDTIEKQNDTCNRRIKDLYDQLNEKDQIIDKFVKENEQMRKNRASYQDLSGIAELKSDMSYKNLDLNLSSRETGQLRKNFGEPKSTSRRTFIQSTEEAENSTKRSRDISVIDGALHIQENLLFTLKQASKEAKDYLVAILGNSEVTSPKVPENICKLNDGLQTPATESQRTLKDNNHIIQELVKEIFFIKLANQKLSKLQLQNNPKSGLENLDAFVNKLHQEEEKVRERLNKCLKLLSQLRTSICDILVESEDPHYLNNQAFTILQDLYTSINQILQTLPQASCEIVALDKKGNLRPATPTDQRKSHTTLKEQLVKDQNEIKHRLKMFSHNINIDDTHEGTLKLSNDLDESESLYRQLQERDAIINEIVNMFSEGLERTNELISHLAKIADSEDAFVLVGDILNEVDTMKTRLYEMVGPYEQRESFAKGKNQNSLHTENEDNERHDISRPQYIVEEDQRELKEGESDIDQEEVEAEEYELLKRIEDLEKENWELKEGKDSADLAFKKVSEQNSRLKILYFTEINTLKEEQKILLEEKQQLKSEIEKKSTEMAKLNQILDSLQTFSNKQLEVVKDKEQKLSTITSQKRDNEQWIKDLEKKLGEIEKEKKEHSETIAMKDKELEVLKSEMLDIKDRYAQLQEKYEDLEMKLSGALEKNRALEAERLVATNSKTDVEDRVRKLNELLQVTRNELRNCRQLVEEKNYDISQMEEEIQTLRDNIKKERSLNKESDFVIHLKNELKSQNAELDALKKKYSEVLKLNEILQTEAHTATTITRRNDLTKDLEKSTYLRDSPEGNETLQKSLRRRDAASNIDKSSYLNESTRQLNRNLSESNWNLDAYVKDYKNAGPLGSEPRYSKAASALSPREGGHSRKVSIMDEKDLEIQRLTNVLKDLTKSLGTSHDSKKSITNSRLNKRYHHDDE